MWLSTWKRFTIANELFKSAVTNLSFQRQIWKDGTSDPCICVPPKSGLFVQVFCDTVVYRFA